jgi:hypothetical protein
LKDFRLTLAAAAAAFEEAWAMTTPSNFQTFPLATCAGDASEWNYAFH